MYKYNRKLNKKNATLLMLGIALAISLVGNIAQDIFYNRALKISNEEITTINSRYIAERNKTVYLKDEDRNVKIDELKNLYKDLKEEYHDLYESCQ